MLYQNRDELSPGTEREILYKILFDMRNDVNELKHWMYGIINEGLTGNQNRQGYIPNFVAPSEPPDANGEDTTITDTEEVQAEPVDILQTQEIETIRKVLRKYNNKRKPAAEALGISERTLYRKIKDYRLEDEQELDGGLKIEN